jgi:hypothetical protein
MYLIAMQTYCDCQLLPGIRFVGRQILGADGLSHGRIRHFSVGEQLGEAAVRPWRRVG